MLIFAEGRLHTAPPDNRFAHQLGRPAVPRRSQESQNVHKVSALATNPFASFLFPALLQRWPEMTIRTPRLPYNRKSIGIVAEFCPAVAGAETTKCTQNPKYNNKRVRIVRIFCAAAAAASTTIGCQKRTPNRPPNRPPK